jgi:hypothetical protein
VSPTNRNVTEKPLSIGIGEASSGGGGAYKAVRSELSSEAMPIDHSTFTSLSPPPYICSNAIRCEIGPNFLVIRSRRESPQQSCLDARRSDLRTYRQACHGAGALAGRSITWYGRARPPPYQPHNRYEDQSTSGGDKQSVLHSRLLHTPMCAFIDYLLNERRAYLRLSACMSITSEFGGSRCRP